MRCLTFGGFRRSGCIGSTERGSTSRTRYGKSGPLSLGRESVAGIGGHLVYLICSVAPPIRKSLDMACP